MDLNKIKEDLKSLIETEVLSVYNVEFLKENDNDILRVTIDKKGFLDSDELDICTVKISEYLDKEDPIENEYMLEVDSRGIDKDFPFDDAKYYMGENIDVKTFDQLHKGKLIKVESDSLTIKTNKNKDIKINANDIVKINVSLEF